MGTWVSESFALVQKGGYLDKLSAIYPAPSPVPQTLVAEQRLKIKLALSQQDDNKLITTLLSLSRFPYNDPYVGFLRESPSAISSNPQTVKRICARLHDMGLGNVLMGLEAPKQFNRQMGQLFNNWLHSDYPFTSDVSQFQQSKAGIMFLDGSGEKLRQFANQQGCGLQKQPDFIAKVKGKYIVGEAKFIGTEGGNQNRGFDDALTLASSSYKNALTIAILDGVVWIPNSGQMSKRLSNFSGNALTALLLNGFLSSI